MHCSDFKDGERVKWRGQEVTVLRGWHESDLGPRSIRLVSDNGSVFTSGLHLVSKLPAADSATVEG